MPTVSLFVRLENERVYTGETLGALVVLDSADSNTIVHSFYAEFMGLGFTGWVRL